jgi:parallel beta-helix repeat protein
MVDRVANVTVANNVVAFNSTGVLIDESTSTLVSGNVITQNGTGIAVAADATGNRITRNSIVANTGLGIDLGVNGRTANDDGSPPEPPDTDTGGNAEQNFPMITFAKTTKKVTTVRGTLRSTPNTVFAIELFANPALLNDEGETFIVERQKVTTDEDGDASFQVKLKKKRRISKRTAITATATDPAGNTSEFADPLVVV